MQTVDDLQRLSALLGRLQPLANVQRGQLIEATSWNTLVEAIMEMARAMLDEVETVADHDHTEEVTIDWLAPTLKNLIERGPLTDPVSENRLREVERRVKSFNSQSVEIERNVQSLRERWDDLATRDVQREANLVRIDKTVNGLPDANQGILDVRTTLDTLRGELQRALEFSDSLDVGGELVNMGEIIGRLESVEALRDSLTTADGQLFDISAFEIQLQELQNDFVPRDELDDILSDQQVSISDEQIASLQTQLSDSLTASQEASLATALTAMQEQIAQDFNEQFGDIDAVVSTAVARLESDMRDAILEQLTSEFNERIDEGLAGIEQQFTEQLSGVQEELSNLSSAHASLTADIDGALSAVKEDVSVLKTDVTKLQSDLGQFGTNVTSLGDSVGAISTRLDTLGEQTVALDSQLDLFSSNMKTIDLQLGGLNDRVGSLENTRFVLGGPPPPEPNITVAGPADFQVVEGIGPAFNQRLLDAGFLTLNQLAATTPEHIAATLSISLDRAARIITDAGTQITQ